MRGIFAAAARRKKKSTTQMDGACVSVDLSSRLVSKQVLSAQQSLTSVFGMGTGGPFALKTLTMGVRHDLSSRLVSKQVLSALQSLTSVFGMGTGGPFALETLTFGAPPGTQNPANATRFGVKNSRMLEFFNGSLVLRRYVDHQTHSPSGNRFGDGAPPGTRTPDPLIKSQLLYQLS